MDYDTLKALIIDFAVQAFGADEDEIEEEVEDFLEENSTLIDKDEVQEESF